MEGIKEYAEFTVKFLYQPKPCNNPCSMTKIRLARCEYTAIAAQHTIIVERLKIDLEGIPQRELSCHSVIAKTQQSELFRVFTETSEYTCDIWKERFARDMAQDASEAMDIAYVLSSEACLHLFCMLSCMGFIDIEAIISDVGLVDAKGDALKFICEYSDKIYPNEKTYEEVIVINLSDPGKRETKTRFGKFDKLGE
jgi:hypothetical protein